MVYQVLVAVNLPTYRLGEQVVTRAVVMNMDFLQHENSKLTRRTGELPRPLKGTCSVVNIVVQIP